eukprot:gene5950-6890_t
MGIPRLFIVASCTQGIVTNDSIVTLDDKTDIERVDDAIVDLEAEIKEMRGLLALKMSNAPANSVMAHIVETMRGLLLLGDEGTQKTALLRHITRGHQTIEIDARNPIQDDPPNLVKSTIIVVANLDAAGPRQVARIVRLLEDLLPHQLAIATASSATNLPQSLTRAGRFDRIIRLSVPSQPRRVLILTRLLAQSPLAHDTLTRTDILKEIGSMTPGFVFNDLQKLCQSAALFALTSASPTATTPQLTLEHFKRAVIDVPASCMQHFDVIVPNTPWSAVGGYDQVKRRFEELIEWPLKHSATFAKLSLSSSSGVILHGPSGCGKTLLVKAAATAMNVNFISIKGSDIFSKWLGESEAIIRDIFARARLSSPYANGSEGGSGVQNRILSQLLNEMDGIQVKSQIFLIGCTTRLDLLDAALLRPGRFDTCLLVDMPSESDRLAILQVQAQHMKFDQDVDLEQLARLTVNKTCAQLESLCNEAGINALKEDINAISIKNKHFHL